METISNTVQFICFAVVLCISIHEMMKHHGRIWETTCLFFGSLFLGELYWFLYLLLRGETPGVFYVSDINWYAADLFLFLIIHYLQTEEERRYRPLAAAIGPIFAVGMCAFYLLWGDIFGNICAVVLMSILLYNSIRGLMYIYKTGCNKANKGLYISTFLYCVIEYTLWTLSIFWMGDGIDNPYFWIDMLVANTVWVSFLPMIRKANLALGEDTADTPSYQEGGIV